jgi:4-hydroxy-2-oxoglutarate aldolase
LVKAREIQIRLLPVNTAVTKQFGIAGLKGAMDLMGMYGGPVRLPLLPIEGGQKKEIEGILRKAGLL